MSKDEASKPNNNSAVPTEHLNLKVKSQVTIYLFFRMVSKFSSRSNPRPNWKS